MMAQRGDEQAAERLYQRWTPRLARAARRYGMNDEASRDLVQDCWMAIFKGLRGLREPARFRSYAFAVLHRRGADHLRSALRERGAMAERANQPEASTQGSTAPADDPSADRLAIAQAFASLPPDQRFAAHLYFVEGLTLREIAEVQDIPEGTAKSRLFLARRKLKAALNDDFEGDLS